MTIHHRPSFFHRNGELIAAMLGMASLGFCLALLIVGLVIV